MRHLIATHSTRRMALAAALALVATPLRAQSIPPGRVAIQVVIPETGRGGDDAVTATRRHGLATAYTITIPRARATPAVLAAAALDVLVLMHRDGDDWRDSQLFRIATDTTAPPNEIRGAEWVLGNILASAPREVTGVGRARVGEMYLPNGASRRAAEAGGRTRISPKRDTVRFR